MRFRIIWKQISEEKKKEAIADLESERKKAEENLQKISERISNDRGLRMRMLNFLKGRIPGVGMTMDIAKAMTVLNPLQYSVIAEEPFTLQLDIDSSQYNYIMNMPLLGKAFGRFFNVDSFVEKLKVAASYYGELKSFEEVK